MLINGESYCKCKEPTCPTMDAYRRFVARGVSAKVYYQQRPCLIFQLDVVKVSENSQARTEDHE